MLYPIRHLKWFGIFCREESLRVVTCVTTGIKRRSVTLHRITLHIENAVLSPYKLASETRRRRLHLSEPLSWPFFWYIFPDHFDSLTPQGLLAEDYQLRQPLKFYPIGFCWRRLPIFHGQLGLNAHMTPRVREGSDFHLQQQRCEYAVAKLPLLLLYSNGFSIRILFSLCWRSNACSKVEKGHQILKVRRRRLQPLVFFFFSNSLMARWFRNEICVRANAAAAPEIQDAPRIKVNFTTKKLWRGEIL